MKNNTNYSSLTIWKMLWVDTIFKMAAAVGLLLLQICLFGQNKWCSMGENAFRMAFLERWVFSHSSPNPALAATRLWAGYGELVGENSISPGKTCEMHIISLLCLNIESPLPSRYDMFVNISWRSLWKYISFRHVVENSHGAWCIHALYQISHISFTTCSSVYV